MFMQNPFETIKSPLTDALTLSPPSSFFEYRGEHGYSQDLSIMSETVAMATHYPLNARYI